MSTKYLGERIDIHCGGIDHIPVHHENEIAQSEAHLGHEWVNFWVHMEFLNNKSGKMSKSKGGFLTLDTLKEKGWLPVHYKYFCLTSHYRSSAIFSDEAMDAAKKRMKPGRRMSPLSKPKPGAKNLHRKKKRRWRSWSESLTAIC